MMTMLMFLDTIEKCLEKKKFNYKKTYTIDKIVLSFLLDIYTYIHTHTYKMLFLTLLIGFSSQQYGMSLFLQPLFENKGQGSSVYLPCLVSETESSFAPYPYSKSKVEETSTHSTFLPHPRNTWFRPVTK